MGSEAQGIVRNCIAKALAIVGIELAISDISQGIGTPINSVNLDIIY